MMELLNNDIQDYNHFILQPTFTHSHSPSPSYSPLQHPGRNIYVGNLPSDATIDQLLNLVKFGPLESIKLFPEKSYAFLAFLDPTIAIQFYHDATTRKITLHGQELKFGWGKNSQIQTNVLLAVQQSNASRNVYIGGIDDSTTHDSLSKDMSKFGPIDQIKIVHDKKIAFIHYLSISTAIKVVNDLPHHPNYSNKRINYGKDRCAYIPRNQQQPSTQALRTAAAIAASSGYPYSMAGFSPSAAAAFLNSNTYENYLNPQLTSNNLAGLTNMNSLSGLSNLPAIPTVPLDNIGNRTVYLGNLSEETTAEELCNAIRGGIIQSIRYLSDKHIAFVTFIDPTNALTFYQVASYQGITIHNRRLKIGWGKHSGPLPPTLALSVQNGATRNVYVGALTDMDTFNETKIRSDFEVFGQVEQVNSLREKGCTFVNFTNIAHAIKAIEAIKNDDEYIKAGIKISYGKDRCGNPPRSLSASMNGRSSQRPSPSPNSTPTFDTSPVFQDVTNRI
ncbi:hypothetical protein E3P92_00871 [Wallemia ichthyophaga]|uniref:RRM domain-containing protein n=2 Tax=Wallemia ichthyophaga TaxID=245174 RepID=A0A4T0J7E1_WALIC|nr:Negative regulator of differentiation 1 [Wallemia ichthyophaga EXF-994]TIA83752.1 hypothetical protein E3P98_00598 [Wallemia ichthyophaga]EOR02048.1 Negative regulator of differentiation 1 [Wallemia ichthyophaga EXF-994]TIA93728.1 hypothetical protein E3P97_00776 [Wallemia ichthyophaga]TIB06733.1 hypothetical protein E3P96_00181 [Wallemia ichthyophaga]TIB15665.1 hypothetical protein E3P90_00744 [Wallemia ichthyophaga]